MAVRGLNATRVLAGGLLIAAASLAYLLVTAGAASADEPTTGSITIVLDASPDDAQDFTFSGCQGTSCGPFTLDDDTDPTRPNTLTAEGLGPGTYAVTQDAVANWTLSSLSCDTGETVSLPNRRATIDVAAGEDVTCTFTNTSASITIVESSYVEDPHDFSYTGCLGSGCSTFSLDDDADPALPDRVSAAGLAPGTYVVTQASDMNWVLSTLSCTTGEVVSVANRRATITLSPGEQTTCKFSNRPPSIAISSSTSPLDPQSFSFTGCQGAGCADFTLDREPSTPQTASHRADVLAVGTYVITQAPNANWPLTAINCDNPETVDLANRRVTITLTAGERQVCRFVNTSASLTLVEDTVPDGPQDVTLHRCAGNDCTTIVLDDDLHDDRPTSTGALPLPPGTYTATADVIDGFELASIACTTGESVDLDTRQVVITLTATEQQRCTFTHRPIPPALADVDEISVGLSSTCAALTSGGARCWGDAGAGGELGDGTASDSPVPATVLDETAAGALTGVDSISIGTSHGCAALSSGQVRCWGDNTSGAIGDGATTSPRLLPVAVSAPTGDGPLTAVTAVAAASHHSCALLGGGEMRCWGNNADGALGDGTTTNRTRPVVVRDPTGAAALDDVVQMSARLNHTCALLPSTQVVCWGDNDDGRLGDGTTVNRSLPTVVSDPTGTGPLTGVSQISAGSTHTCALLSSGEARCWGDNTRGGLGDGTTTDRYRPVVVGNADGTGPLTGITRLAAGGDQTCALLDDGTLRCWGGNQYGQLGDGSLADRSMPVVVVDATGAALTDAVGLSAGYRTTCVWRADGDARCWGSNGSGGLGDGTTVGRRRPVPVIDPMSALHTLDGVISLVSGDNHTCAQLASGQARCWGGGAALLGDPDVRSSNTAVTVMDEVETGPLTGIAQLAAGDTHTCALLESGQARCWGTNNEGELGDGTTTTRALPVAVSNEDGTGPLTGVVQIAAGDSHTCATLDDGQVRCWGDNSSGALGDSTTALRRTRPVAVLASAGSGHLTGVSAVSAASGKTCALLSSGQVRCWGSGRLGNGTSTTGGGSLPVVVLNPAGNGPLTDVTSIAVGYAASCATIAGGQARCWGSMPGNGTSTAALLPVVLPDPSGTGPLTTVASISAGPTHTCATLTTGQARCWGATNQLGELGTPPPAPSTLRPMVVNDPADAGAMVAIAAVSVGDEHTCALSSAGRVRCFGLNYSGSLGDGTTAYSRRFPVTVMEGPG